VYVCHCRACQRRTGAVVHSGSKSPGAIEGDNKFYERDADSGFKIRFHFCPNCGSTTSWHWLPERAGSNVFWGKSTVTPTSTGSRWVASPIRTFRRQLSRGGKRRCIRGSKWRRRPSTSHRVVLWPVDPTSRADGLAPFPIWHKLHGDQQRVLIFLFFAVLYSKRHHMAEKRRKDSIANKLSRGTFAATPFLAVMKALGVE
jgi:hypothetical protein